MEPVSATLAIIAATKTAVEAAKNVKDIGATLDQLFSSHEGAEKTKKKQAAKTRREQILRIRTGEKDGGETSEAISLVLQKKDQERELDLLKAEINRKWPSAPGQPTTWDQIIDQRQKLLVEKKEAAKAAKAKARQQKIDDKIFWHKVLVESAKVVFLLLVIAGIGWFLHYASTVPKGR
jgi:hypothetical protein